MTKDKILIELRIIRNILYEHYQNQSKQSLIDENVFEEVAKEQINEELLKGKNEKKITHS